jgi:hypothetical protein
MTLPIPTFEQPLNKSGAPTNREWYRFFQLVSQSFNTGGGSTTNFAISSAEIAAGVTPTNLSYAPGDVRRYGTNTTPGTTDMTAALQASINQAKQTGGAEAYWPAGTYLVSALTASGTNYNIRTGGGRSTILKQATGQVDVQILIIKGQNINVGDLAFQGNLQTDGLANTHEFNHCVYVYDDANVATIINIHLGDLYGTDIRGDVLYVGSPSSSRPVTGVRYGTVSGTNVFRNLVTCVGGQMSGEAIVHDGPVGYRDFDVEPNAGTSLPGDFRVKYVKAGIVQVASGEPTLASVVDIGTLDCDLNRIAGTTPAYRLPPGVNGQALIVTYAQYLHIGYLKCRNYNYVPVTSSTASIKSNVLIDVADFSNCCITEAVYNSLFADQGSGGISRLEIGNLIATLFSTSKMCFNGNGMVVRVRSGIVSGGLLAASIPGGQYENMTIDMNSAAGNLLVGCNDTILTNVTLANAASATGLVNCSRNTWTNVTATFSALEGSGCAENRLIHSTINSIKYVYDYASLYFLSKAMADANQTLSNIESTAVLIRCVGALTAQRNLVVSAVPREYSVDNSTTGGFGVQVIGPSGTGTVIAGGKKAIVAHDGTNVVRLTADV